MEARGGETTETGDGKRETGGRKINSPFRKGGWGDLICVGARHAAQWKLKGKL